MIIFFIIGILIIALGIYSMINTRKKEKNSRLSAGAYKSNNKAGWVFIAFGTIWCVTIGMAIWAPSSEAAGKFAGVFFPFGMSILFILIGFNIAIIKPRRLKNEMADCTVVQGSLIDYRVRRRKKGGAIYCPQYGFYHNGEQRTIWGTVGSSSRKFRQIGRQVSIVINNRTGRIYCLEDERSRRTFGFMFVLMGLFFLAMTFMSIFPDLQP